MLRNRIYEKFGWNMKYNSSVFYFRMGKERIGKNTRRIIIKIGEIWIGKIWKKYRIKYARCNN